MMTGPPDYIRYWEPNKEFDDAMEKIGKIAEKLNVSMDEIANVLKWLQWKPQIKATDIDISHMLKK